MKQGLIPCGCDFLKEHPTGIKRNVSFYDDGIVRIVDDGVTTDIRLSDYQRAVFGKKLVLFLPHKNTDDFTFCVACDGTLELHNLIKKQIKCTTFSLERKK